MKKYTFGEVKDELLGKINTPRRDEYEAKLKKEEWIDAFNSTIELWKQTRPECRKWRKGQMLFNMLFYFNSQWASEIKGSELDPFYFEEGPRIAEFWQWLSQKLETL